MPQAALTKDTRTECSIDIPLASTAGVWLATAIWYLVVSVWFPPIGTDRESVIEGDTAELADRRRGLMRLGQVSVRNVSECGELRERADKVVDGCGVPAFVASRDDIDRSKVRSRPRGQWIDWDPHWTPVRHAPQCEHSEPARCQGYSPPARTRVGDSRFSFPL
jgi:hypothetical protein